MKKIIAIVLAIVLVAGLSIAGTLAYLQDDDYAENTMTTGNVYIEQLEYQRVMDANGSLVEGVEGTDFNADYGITRSYKLEEFKQNKPALPAVYNNGEDATESYDDFQQLWNGVGAPGSNEIFDDTMKNVVDKFVFVENTGNTSAYFRTIIAVETPEGVQGKIHLNMNDNIRYDYNCELDGRQGLNNMTKLPVVINGTHYRVYVALHTEALAPDAISRPSFMQAYLAPTTTNEDCALFGDTWDILTLSQAVQAAGFDNAQTALDAAFGEVTEENVLTWFADIASTGSNGNLQ